MDDLTRAEVPGLARYRMRLDEEEAVATGATPGQWRLIRDPLGVHVENGDGRGRIVMRSGEDRADDRGLATAAHIALHGPDQTLSDIAVKRRILDHYERWAKTLHNPPEGWSDDHAGVYRMAMEWVVNALLEPSGDAWHNTPPEDWRDRG